MNDSRSRFEIPWLPIDDGHTCLVVQYKCDKKAGPKLYLQLCILILEEKLHLHTQCRDNLTREQHQRLLHYTKRAALLLVDPLSECFHQNLGNSSPILQRRTFTDSTFKSSQLDMVQTELQKLSALRLLIIHIGYGSGHITFLESNSIAWQRCFGPIPGNHRRCQFLYFCAAPDQLKSTLTSITSRLSCQLVFQRLLVN